MATSSQVALPRKSSASLIDGVLLASWTFLYAALLIAFRLLRLTERRPMKKEQ
jgi:hypothetical protein